MIVIGPNNGELADEVIRRSGTNLNACLHCRTCAGGCPFSADMDFPPHGVIRLIQLSLGKTALECHTIWICVGCHTCSIQCPMAIDIASVMDTMREMAIESGACIAEPNILGFHDEVLNSIKKHGRTHKLGIMMGYKVRVRDWFSDMDIGVKMLAKRKLELLPSRIEAREEIRRLFDKDEK